MLGVPLQRGAREAPVAVSGAEAAPRDDAAAPPPGTVVIPEGRRGSWVARVALVEPDGAPSEHFRHFALRLARTLAARGQRSVAVASALRAEGKTTVACNLALALATVGEGRRVALVDLDLRRPSVAAGLDVRPSVGIESVLAGTSTLDEARLRTQLDTLDLFAARRPTRNIPVLLGGPAVAATLGQLTRRYDVVVVDTPPILIVPDVALLIPHLDACFAVVRLGVTRRVALARALEELPSAKRLGAFLNSMQRPTYYRHYGYCDG